ncbi:MAG: transposase [Anaerolineales bacterium]|nr:transposase [Anaerolineales bacterium]
MDPSGKRRILGVSISMSEAKVHWRSFLKSLADRGISGIQQIISDDHAGLGAARRVISIFPNEAFCLRLISVILMEIDEKWQTGKVYLSFKEDLIPF